MLFILLTQLKKARTPTAQLHHVALRSLQLTQAALKRTVRVEMQMRRSDNTEFMDNFYGSTMAT